MSLYWYAMCEKHKQRCDAGTSHASGNFQFDDILGSFIQKHSWCGITFCADPDPECNPELYECEDFVDDRS